MKKIIIASCLFAAIVVVLLLRDLIQDRRNELEIMKPIILLEKAPQDYPKENKEVGKIQIGEKIKVLRIGYGKDFRAWKIRNSMGQEGWFIEEKDNIKVKK
jgi:hypothetical protein